MLHTLKQTLHYLKWDWPTLIIFELLHKLIALTILIPHFFSTLTSMMQESDLTYLSPSVIKQFILSPSTLVLGLFTIICFGYYFYFELHTIFIYFKCAIKKQPLTFFQLIKQSLKESIRIFLPQNFLILVLLIFFIPLTTFIFKINVLDSGSVTEFLFDFIYQRPPFHPLYFAFIAMIQLLFMPFLFTLPVMIYQKMSFLQAMRQSFYLTKGRVTSVTPLMLNWSLITALTLMLIYTMGILIIAFLTKLIIPSQEVILSFFDTSFTLKNMLSSIAPTFIIMINCAFISTLYAQINHPSSFTSLSSSTSHIRHLWIQYVIIFILALLMGELISPNNLYTNHLSDEIQIIAHRASAVYVPENTLSALDYAIESGAQMAEIDIQQTLDKEIILMHDLSLKRTTGYDRKVSESTYHEIQSLEAGSWFSDVFNGEIIPTLEQALQKSKDQITLMIEIKSQPHPVDIVRQVIELIERYDMEKQCLIGAMDYRVLQAVKMINPKIQTVYITALAYGDYQDLEDVDYYSIEASFISLALIDQIHRSGKQIYTWTVNKASTMQSMISMQVDGIVTDDPILLKNQLTQTNDKYISFIANLFFNASEE